VIAALIPIIPATFGVPPSNLLTPDAYVKVFLLALTIEFIPPPNFNGSILSIHFLLI